MCMDVHLCVGPHVCAYMWRPKVDIVCLLLSLSILHILKQGLTLDFASSHTLAHQMAPGTHLPQAGNIDRSPSLSGISMDALEPVSWPHACIARTYFHWAITRLHIPF